MRSSSLPTVSPCPAGTCPSSNGAAVVLLHGAASTRTAVLDQAAVLAEHGYGVLLDDARGHGRSGRNRHGLRLVRRPRHRRGALLLGGPPGGRPGPTRCRRCRRWAASRWSALRRTDTRIRAVVGEGVTGRGSPTRAGPRHWRGWVQRGIDATLYGTADLLTDASPPISLRDAVAATAPTPVLLIAGGATMGNAEEDADRWIQAGSPSTVDLWVVPDTGTPPRCAPSPRNGGPRSSDSSTTNSCSNNPGDTPSTRGMERSVGDAAVANLEYGVTPGRSCRVNVDHDIDAAVE